MSDIKLYRWWSEALKQYGSGHLISYGTTEDEARERILADLDTAMKEYFSWKDYPGIIYDEDDLEEFDRWREQVRADLRKEPASISTSLYINGSE